MSENLGPTTDQPTTRGRHARELEFDVLTTPFFSNVCERFLELSCSTAKDGFASSALDPKSLNQQNAAAAAEIYSALGPDQLRLLKLYKGNGPVRCSVLVAREESAPQYEALSYVWGSQDNLQSIQLDNRDYLVTRNLFEILLRLRRPDEDRIFWIDALVINQSDMVERAAEVTKMLRRYSGAAKTVVWLEKPLDYLPMHVADSRLNIASAFKFIAEANVVKRPKDDNSKEWIPIKQAIEAVLGSTYFTRAWVVQEVMYSNDVTLHYNSLSLGMSKFLSIADINDHYTEAPLCGSLVVGDKRLAIRPGFGRSKKYLSIPSWLGCYVRYRDCSNPRDCLFAYYGCFAPEARRQIKVDYARSALGMAADITRAWIASEKDLDFLLQIGSRDLWWADPIADPRSIPSWLPSYFGKENNCIGTVFAGPDRPGVQRRTRNPVVGFAEHSNALHIRGILLGTINSLGKPRMNPIAECEPFDSFLIDQVLQCDGSISEIDHAVRDVLRIYYSTPELYKKLQKNQDVVETLKLEVEVMNKADGLNESNNRHLRTAEGLCSLRVAFRFHQAAGSRAIRHSTIDIPFGLGTPDVKTGDLVYAIIGCSLALVLRRVGSYFLVIGNSRVFGFWNGISLQNIPELAPSAVVEDIILR
jgi:hypothetical protein